MKINLQLTALIISLSIGVNAQTGRIAIKNQSNIVMQSNASNATNRGCATLLPGNNWDNWFNNKVEEFKQNIATGKSQVVNYTIPVVVHVIHGGSTNTGAIGTYPNLSQIQINSQTTVLNQDYAGTGFNVGNLAATAFSAIGAANCNITFCMAQKDPSGVTLVEPGIDRVSYVVKGWANPTVPTTPASFQTFINGTVKPGTIWDPTRYLNIWITDCNASVGLLGYATFPAGSGLTGLPGSLGTATTDGVWVWSGSYGNTGTFGTAQYTKGRTASHEIGHWLGLRHIGGDGVNSGSGVQSISGDCTASDFCNDTPPQRGGFAGGQYGQNFGSPTYPLHATGTLSCSAASPNGDMYMNIMDYTDDPICYMFTNDQRTRMQTAMLNGTHRSLLNTSASTLCTISSSAPIASISIPATGCTGSNVATNNLTNGTPIPSYVWSSLPATGVTFNPNNTATNPTINFTNPGNYTITVAATNSLGSNSNSKVITITNCTVVQPSCNDTLTNVTSTGTLLPSAAGSDTNTAGCSPKAGYIMGSNCYDDAEKAEFFSSSLYSSITSPQIKSVIVIFYKDGTKGTGGNTSTPVNLKIYNGTLSGGPTGTATPIATVTANIGSILAVTATNSANYVGNPSIVYSSPILRPFKYTFPTPINAPTTNGFFASITIPTAAGDTAVIMDDGSLAAGTNWELWSNNTWHSIPIAWSGYDASMAILPIVQCASGTITTLSYNSILNANISLLPNPTNGLINAIVTLPSAQNIDITITNTLGQLISSTKYSNVTNNVFTLDLNNYSNGVYFVTFNNGQEKIVKRIILSK
jgi:hypothetical protein